jgi:hypothetical protein
MAPDRRRHPDRGVPVMIDLQGGKILIECDSCDEVFVGDEDTEFLEVWGSARREGWRTKKIGDEWVHGCPRCGV